MSRPHMQAAVIVAPTRLQIEEVPLPEPGAGEVRVELEGCGVCGSNLPPWEGRPWFNYPLGPGELGHEGWGRVHAIGKGVQGWETGDRVAMLSQRAYAQYDVAPAEALVRLPDSLAAKPFPGEALGCALNVFRRCDVKAGQTVAIVGIGFLGALLTALSARAGAQVIAISRRPFALEMAEKLGAAHALTFGSREEVLERVNRLTSGC